MLQFGGFPIASRLFPKKQEVPFSHLRIQDILASPRSLSQLVTTFIGTRAERSPSWVVASHVCIPHHASNPSVSKHANSASTENHLPEGWFSSALPPTAVAEVLSNLPTYLTYMKKSDTNLPSNQSIGRKLWSERRQFEQILRNQWFSLNRG